MTFFWSGETGAPEATVMHDFANGFAGWDRVDADWTTGTGGVPGNPPNGTHWARALTGTVERYIVALRASLAAAFEPGEVLYVPVYVTSGSLQIYYGNPDTSPSNQYEFVTDPVTQYILRKDVSGTLTEQFTDPQPLEKGGGSGEWHNVYLYWHPDTSTYTEPGNTVGTGQGDVLIQIFRASDARPIFSRYAEWGDLTYTASDAGIGFGVGGSSDVYIGNPEVGPPAAFDQVNLAQRAHMTGEIHRFATADLNAFDGGRAYYRMSTPGEFPTPPSGRDVVLVHPGSSNYSTMFSLPGARDNYQFFDLPNYLPNGSRARVHVYADGGNLQLTDFAAGDRNEDNCIRCEVRWSEGEIRILQWVANGFTSISNPVVTGGTPYGNWFTWEFDRTGAGDSTTVRFKNAAGTVVAGPITWTMNSALSNNAGVGVVGAGTTGNHCWSEWVQY